MANKHVNAVIVGAGAGGGIAAKELAQSGLSVVLLERGVWRDFDDIHADELISQRTSMLKAGYGPDNERYRRVVPDRKGGWRTVKPNEKVYNNNAGCVGGGTLSYGAMAWRFLPDDFRMRSRYGTPEGSTLEDWPLTYDELEPYYEKAEYEIGVAGDDAGNPYGPPRKNPFPMPAFRYDRKGELLYAAGRRIGVAPFPISMARNSVRYNGRPRCIRMRTCVGYACPVNAKGGSQNTVIPAALKTGNCELRTACKASEILVDERGRATGVHYFDEHQRKQTQTADIVVVAASATETARLLLNSKSPIFPEGAGNTSGWIGHNIQGHAYCHAMGLFDDVVYDDVGPGATIASNRYNHGLPGIIGGGSITNGFIDMPYMFTKRRPPGAKTWGLEHKEYQRYNFKRNIVLNTPVQELPVFDCKVEIDPAVKDYWGVPTIRLSGYRHQNDIKAGEYIAARAEEWLLEAGAARTYTTSPGRYASPSQHQAGTCRMGNDPKTSVTNRYGQLHDIDNVFVADGSLHVTNGGFNPALTIMALSYWVSGYIVKEWKGTKFRS